MNSVYLTIDVEDWFQVENLRPAFPISVWDKQEWHVEANTERLLQILEDNNSTATFFVLGIVAEKFPSLVCKIKQAGHEIASHGYSHRLLYDLSEDELFEELDSSKKILEDITGQKVNGFRAPSFSITEQAIDLMSDTGYKYDSSYNDFGSHDRYGQLELENWNLLNQGIGGFNHEVQQ
jgi:polysaccharide deacetylase family protein (PEP-CTERM system associated)